MAYKSRDIIHIADFSRDEILHILDTAEKLKRSPQSDLLRGKILGSCFFEPSTRTRLSFESAMHRLGGSVIGFDNASNISTRKGETLRDSMKMLDYYADIAVIRHPLEGSAQLAADSIEIPVINAGDGSNQHPTQTFLDLFTIRETQGRLESLSIALAGDLKHGRTVHSLAEALISFQCRLYFIAPESLEMPKPLCDHLKENGIKFSFHRSLEEVMPKLDILYMTRIQEERFQDRKQLQTVNQSIKATLQLLEQSRPNLKVLHPLPRMQEIDPQVDNSPKAYYFQQAGNGLCTRQALLALTLLGEI
ncbi:Aspartate carbamoyltransferase [Waddlia chondrophila 2032/99]|uniref:Aspartate carbamoyltransferase n=2 Tax=Waddlia chondrophila TaxID=71667 RepID=D6YUA4_WADCW|nr:aspartate carbamoyltransferase [Waddlia chondrophila]ADI37715.1 aspartate carbamoyltransferase, catalytic subunit [Waddlia chondrophila WSU 86-1044]CCB90941.1 Aspartate carbamoyltransferase [Waddlia chondrophila 2032/99]